MLDNVCVCCGKVIPEGRQICKSCETEGQRMGMLRKPAAVTNGDLIRSMDNEQLAKFLNSIVVCCRDDLCGKRCPLYDCCAADYDWQEKWLDQEAST